MAVIIKNECIAKDIYLLELHGKFEGRAGQFYMLKASDTLDPFLPRPISINDLDENKITFLYQKKGKGTALISEMKIGDNLQLTGPFGNGFNFTDHDTSFVGGGIGIAPLYYAVKTFKQMYPQKKANVYLGFSDEAYYLDEFKMFADILNVNIGGKITDEIDYDSDDIFITCGPEIMMKTLYDKSKKQQNVFVSLEKRMACAVGACLGCSIKTKSGMKRVCKDGPVFEGGEVFYEQA